MRTALAFAALLASFSAIIAAPTGEGFIGSKGFKDVPTGGAQNVTTDGKDIILWFKTGDSAIEDSVRAALEYVKRSPEDDSVDVLRNDGFTAVVVKGVDDDNLAAFQAMDSIAQVEEVVGIESFLTQQTNSTWGLQRISNAAGASGDPQAEAYTYTYDDVNLAAGVDVYVVDTGVRTSHAVFQGRATTGFAFTGATAGDGDGHGTHTAGTAAGAKFGVAQGANVIAVKVLGDDGTGSSSDTIAGMNWVINNHNKRKTEPGFVGSLMSMSWGLSGTAKTVNDAVLVAISQGIHVSVAAGNDGADACGSTPAMNGGANSAVVTVGSVNIENQVSTFSNIGKCVDIYAPGEQILSAWNTGDTIINFLSGTSMACPHVSGVMAYLMAQDPATLGQNPAALKAKLLATARSDAFSGSTGGGPAVLLSNGVDAKIQARSEKKWVVTSGDDLPGQKRTVTGGPANWAKDLVKDLNQRWTVHSRDSPLRL
ncbi:subtilisin-like protein [Melanomma pulvis-pyrius CBS 109.77]|uniref:Subtilisin-like protein n=1 Tax=Melanomma pulvis-pyrius CBS 109.77 TaxID=1314802 RepID=A0A6A6X310_9PLEO|nr:subtilisin-like protein [Melanomma pulvis-pyrius CBS 109.77]